MVPIQTLFTKNKTMVEYAEICKDNDQVAQMVWEELSERL
jgi:hypothetical protein